MQARSVLSMTALAAALAFPGSTLAQDQVKTGSRPSSTPATRRIETLHLGEDRMVRGRILKETADHVFLDLGFDVARVPISAIVRRETSRQNIGASVKDRGLFKTGERTEKTVAEGAQEVGPAVVKITTGGGQGSGFITSSEGYVVTNFHVVDGFEEVDVTLFVRDGDSLRPKTIRDCEVVAQNPAIDLALVKIPEQKDFDLPSVFVAEDEKSQVGDRVFAVGTPIGLDRTVSSGIISVTKRAYEGHTMLQITTPINPGNSGGPLFNLRGEVVGVNSAGYMGMQGLNFAIPVKYVKDFLRNREAFAVDGTRGESGVHFLPAPRKPKSPEATEKPSGSKR